MKINFTKMHGLGNDFMVIDATTQKLNLSSEQIRSLAHRHFGVGYDQLLIVEPPVTQTADFTYRIFNADGGEVFQCGNGARCFARFIHDKKLSTKDQIIVDTDAGQLSLKIDNKGLITVNMGIPRHSPTEIPLQASKESAFYSINVKGIEQTIGAVSIGNPHAVIEVDHLESAPLLELGAVLENHPFFPERANIGFMQIIDRQHIKLRVYERGVAETLACGSGACAAVIIGIERKQLDQHVKVSLLGGELEINWQGRGHPVLMTGSSVSVFEGQIEL